MASEDAKVETPEERPLTTNIVSLVRDLAGMGDLQLQLLALCETQLHVLNDLQCYAKQYIQRQPETAALVCLGIGFVLGWKLKPW